MVVSHSKSSIIIQTENVPEASQQFRQKKNESNIIYSVKLKWKFGKISGFSTTGSKIQTNSK